MKNGAGQAEDDGGIDSDKKGQKSFMGSSEILNDSVRFNKGISELDQDQIDSSKGSGSMARVKRRKNSLSQANYFTPQKSFFGK